MNYNLMMEEQIKNIPKGTKLLLHACCAPCSSAVIERLTEYFQITIFYYNPNIDKKEEYDKRLNELHKFIDQCNKVYPIDIIDGNYDNDRWNLMATGLENEPERGKRCFECYKLRLEETAKVADKENYPYFCTTLTLSPHKNSNWINEIGEDLNNNYECNYLYSDFKKKNGYKRSIELSNEYNLYRQDYCGCIYSKRD